MGPDDFDGSYGDWLDALIWECNVSRRCGDYYTAMFGEEEE